MRLLVRTRLFGAPAGEDRLAARHYRGRDCAVAATSRTRQMLLHGRDHPADITAVGAGNLAPVTATGPAPHGTQRHGPI